MILNCKRMFIWHVFTSSTLNFDRHIWGLTSWQVNWGKTVLWCHNITHTRVWSSATRSPELSRTNEMGPPTPTSTPSASAALCILWAHAAARALRHKHARTFNFQRDSVKMDKVIAGQTAYLERSTLSVDKKGEHTSWKWQGVITSQHLPEWRFTAVLFGQW